MLLYQYQCSKCGTACEQWRSIEDRNSSRPCAAIGCGGELRHVLSLPAIVIDGTDPSWPTAGAKWERDRERRMAVERKNLENHGTYD